ncbi:hypothetical protein PSV09DRAFT_2183893 [Bipolaris maydis]|nr:hypothetical protein BM1_09357 [Bipolaris maydis]KAJ5065049.1 hypothetical protein J3E74DRAFT_204990 [Bipolaris maydis]KAJ6213910.1 hypothetical protein PSV09DRAFT_2183893 [Bipolaris maydis]KAJ6275115.1 hypothetical protein PSV08DRAFT_347897 [Bipolaris maydis]
MNPLTPSLDTSLLTSTPPSTIPTTIPLGFAAQLRRLQNFQEDHTSRISALERETSSLKALTATLTARIEALEAHNAYLASRRRELVAQLNNLRTLNQQADNAFQMRSVDIQPDDLERMLSLHSAMVTTAVNQHQRALAQLRASMHVGAAAVYAKQGQGGVRYTYPPAYSEQGYCFQHNMPYCCQVCGK